MDIQIQNELWQIFYNGNLTYYIFGAYLDTRPLASENKVLIRILSMINLITENSELYPKVYCQMWFREKFAPVIVPVDSTKFIWQYKWGSYPAYSFPHILTCTLPKAYRKWIPKSVSLVAAACNKATNNMRVTYRPLRPGENKKEFAVCIKGLDFPYNDISYRLVEYIETLRILGAQKIEVYTLEIHDNITKVLDYYQASEFLEHRPFTLSLRYSNLPEYRHLQKTVLEDEFILHDIIAYNDCIYRNMYHYKYIGVWDVDELPLPLGIYRNWHELVELPKTFWNSKCNSFTSLCFFCAYFPKYEGTYAARNYPDYFYMLQHIRRVREYAKYGWATKCLHNTDYVIATHQHFPIHYTADCRDYTFRKYDAQMNHYREPPFEENLTNPVTDKSLWRFGQQIMETSLKVYDQLGFFK